MNFACHRDLSAAAHSWAHETIERLQEQQDAALHVIEHASSKRFGARLKSSSINTRANAGRIF
jgi:hypothetical protein